MAAPCFAGFTLPPISAKVRPDKSGILDARRFPWAQQKLFASAGNALPHQDAHRDLDGNMRNRGNISYSEGGPKRALIATKNAPYRASSPAIIQRPLIYPKFRQPSAVAR